MKRIERVINVVCIAWLIWLLLSWIDVVLHNVMLNPVYHSWNFFALFFEEMLL